MRFLRRPLLRGSRLGLGPSLNFLWGWSTSLCVCVSERIPSGPLCFVFRLGLGSMFFVHRLFSNNLLMHLYMYVCIQACLSWRSQAPQGAEDFPSTVRAQLCQWKVGTSRPLPWEVPNRTSLGSVREVPDFHWHSQAVTASRNVCRCPRSFPKIQRK